MRMDEPWDDQYVPFGPSLLQALGLLVVKFASLEDMLARAVALMLARDGSADTAHLLVRKVGFRTLIDLFGGVCRNRFGEEHVLYAKVVCETLDSIAKQRNELVHSVWDDPESTGEISLLRSRLGRSGTKEERQPVHEETLLKLAHECDQMYFGLATFLLDYVLPANEGLPDPLGGEPEAV